MAATRIGQPSVGCMMICFIISLSSAARLAAQVSGRSISANQAQGTGDQLVLQFKTAPRTESQVVRLGDLVDIISWGKREAPELLEIPLAPAPAVGKTQAWSATELMRHLELRGIPQTKVRWSGSESATLLRAAPAAAPIAPKAATQEQLTPAFVQDRLVMQAESNLIQATREYLWLQTGERTDWRIAIDVPAEHAAGFAQRRSIESIGGGAAPWVGPQELTFIYKHQGKTFEVEMTAEIEPPRTVVVAARPIRRDEVIDESALAYASLSERMADQQGEFYEDIEELIGKQLRRSLSTGLPVPRSAIGEPIVVSSGELVEIESVSGSVSVKTAGRALSGGAVGELINVEVLPQRKRLTATVVGPLQVRISGGAHLSQATAAKNAGRSAAGSKPSLTAQVAKRSKLPGYGSSSREAFGVATQPRENLSSTQEPQRSAGAIRR